MNKKTVKKVLFIFLIFFILSGGYLFFNDYFSEIKEISLTDLSNQINEEKIEKIEVLDGLVIVTPKEGEDVKSIREPEGAFSDTITNYGADEEKLQKIDIIQEDRTNNSTLTIASFLVVFLLLLGLFFYLVFWKNNKLMYFWKAKDRLFGKTEEKNSDYGEKDPRELLNEEESKTLEFKSSLRWDYHQGKINKDLEKVIAKTVAAFMNTKGGVLLIGVDDNGEVVGIEKDLSSFNGSKDGFLKKLSEIINKHLGPESNFLVTVSFFMKDQKNVCVLKVDMSNRPVYLKDDKSNKFYIRTQNSSMELTGIEMDQYKEERF